MKTGSTVIPKANIYINAMLLIQKGTLLTVVGESDAGFIFCEALHLPGLLFRLEVLHLEKG